MKLHVITTGGTIDKIYFDAKSDYQVGEPVIGAVQSKHPGVYIAMNGEIFDAGQVRKNVAANRFEHFRVRHRETTSGGLAEAGFVTATFEIGGKKGLDHLQTDLGRHHRLAETENIRVVV